MIDLTKFDKYQLQAIKDTGDKNIVVRASAGAGKTLVLINRILYLALDAKKNKQIPLSRLIALTFTDAAATEMKVRLEKELNILSNEVNNKEEKENIQKQLNELINARISTIDSFCLDIVKKYYATISLDPEVLNNIITDQRKKEIQLSAFHEAIASWYSDSKLKDALYMLHQYFVVRPEDTNSLYEVIDTIINAADNSNNVDEFFDSILDIDNYEERYSYLEDEYLMINKNIIANILKEVHNIKAVLLDNDPSLEQINHIDKTIKTLEKCLEIDNYNDLQIHFDSITDFFPKAKRKSKNNPLGQEEYSNIKSMDKNSDLKQVMNMAFSTLWPEELFKYFHKQHKQIELLLSHLAKDTYHNAQKLKEKEKCITFSDIEHATYKILSANNNHVAKLINGTFDEILIDEFQDTSELQNNIIELISQNRRIFRVGDVKQSIYRFRKAKPYLMQQMIDNKDDKYNIYTLRYNYRSNENIVKFSNLLFSRIMNLDGSQNSYSDDDYVEVNQANKIQLNDLDRSHVHFVLINNEIENNATNEEETEGSEEIIKFEAETAKTLKANWIAKKIKSMVEESQNTDTPLQYQDFAVLVRTHKTQIPIKRSFDAFEIPYSIDTKEGFFKSDLCQDIISFLNYFLYQDLISYTSILTSPLCQLSDIDLANLRIAYNNETEKESFLAYLQDNLPQITLVIDELYNEALISPLNFLHRLYKTKLCTFNSEINNINYYDYLSEVDKANFEYLLHYCATQGFTNIHDFYNTLLMSEDERSSEAITIQKGDNVTIATTIHDSKGLQYKYVFLWSTKNSLKPHHSSLTIDSNNWFGFEDIELDYRFKYPSRQYVLTKLHEEYEELDEYIRTIYVALTRPVEELFIVDTIDAKQQYNEYLTFNDLLKNIGMSGIITSALQEEEIINGTYLFDTIYEKENLVRPDKKDINNNNELYIREDYNHLFPSIPQLIIPSMINQDKNPSLISLDRYQRGTSYGTAIHKALELLDPYEAWDEKMISEVLAKDINNKDFAIKSIMAFNKWDIYQYIINNQMNIYKEEEVYYEDNNQRFYGVLDFLAINEEEAIIIDYKTDSGKLDEIKDSYFEQIKTYKYIIEKLYPNRKIKAYIYSLHHNEALAI